MKFKTFRFNKVKSTNDTAIRIIRNSNIDYGMVIANEQKKGRGQYGKKWISYNGNIFISFFYKLDHLKVSLKQITKINCLLVKKLLSIYYKKRIILKKPNDLLINKKKICGILQEKICKLQKTYLIVGIGINLIKNPNLKGIPTTNLNKLLNKRLSKIKIEKKIKKIFEIKLGKLYR